MAAFLIVHRREITDAEKLKDYRKGVNSTIAKFGGKVVVRADGFDVLEGDWHAGRKRDDALPERVTVVEFPDMKALKAWYQSDDYAGLRSIRQQSSISDVVAVEGQPA
jgi:uncharacterized protein (DUF1330 family)